MYLRVLLIVKRLCKGALMVDGRRPSSRPQVSSLFGSRRKQLESTLRGSRCSRVSSPHKAPVQQDHWSRTWARVSQTYTSCLKNKQKSHNWSLREPTAASSHFKGSGEAARGGDDDEDGDEEDFDWQVEQEVYKESSEEELGALQKYGFGNQRCGVFERLQVRLEIWMTRCYECPHAIMGWTKGEKERKKKMFLYRFAWSDHFMFVGGGGGEI